MEGCFPVMLEKFALVCLVRKLQLPDDTVLEQEQGEVCGMPKE